MNSSYFSMAINIIKDKLHNTPIINKLTTFLQKKGWNKFKSD